TNPTGGCSHLLIKLSYPFYLLFQYHDKHYIHIANLHHHFACRILDMPYIVALAYEKTSFNYFGDDCFTQLIKPPTFIMSTWRGDNACAAFILIPFPFTSTSTVFVVSILDR